MSQARRIQRAQRSRVGELVPQSARTAPIDRNLLAAITSGQRAEERLIRVFESCEESRAYTPKLPKRVATFGYVLLVTFLVAWALAAIAEGLR